MALDTLDRLSALLAKQSGIERFAIEPGNCLGQKQVPTDWDPHCRARCLGLDSLDLVDTALRLEEEFGIDIPDSDVDRAELGTVGGLWRYLDKRLDSPRDADVDAMLDTIAVAPATVATLPLDGQ